MTVFTDGSCVRGNPGDAAGAYVAVRDGVVLDAAGVPIGHSTNNRGEMTGALHGLRRALDLAEPGEAVLLVSDSTYVIDGLPKAVVHVARQDANHDLWQGLSEAQVALRASGHELHAKWVAGHAGNSGNTLCDKLARAAATTQIRHTAAMVDK